jgi:hemerythrin-like domain-containing protein
MNVPDPARHASPATTSLRHEHEVILRALALVERVALAAAAGTPGAREALVRLVDFFQNFADRCHHAKEEQHLFPALERRGLPREGGPVAVMLAEHHEGRRLLAALAAGDPAAARGYVALLRAHIDKENDVLFPLAEQVLAEEDQVSLHRAFEAVEQQALGLGTHERWLAELEAVERALAGGAGAPAARALSPSPGCHGPTRAGC